MKIVYIKRIIPLIILIFLPWFNANYLDQVIIQNNYLTSSFFEINPCKTALAEYLYLENEIENFNFLNDGYSSILCFGRISQVKVNSFYIGSNFLINTFIYFLIFNQLLKLKYGGARSKKLINTKYLSITSLIFCGLIFSDRKFYENEFYFLNPFQFRSYLFLYFFIFCISYLFIESYYKYEEKFINLLPFLFLFTGIISGSNLNIFLVIFIYLGIENFVLNKKLFKYFKLFLPLILLWSINARDVYVFSENQYKVFSSTSYDLYSIFFYSIFFFITLSGVNKFLRSSIKHFSYEKFMNVFSLVIVLKTLIYILQQKFPILEIFINIYFGDQFTLNYSSKNFIDFLLFHEKIIFLFFFLFLYKFFNTYKLNISDIFALLILISFVLSSPNYISLVSGKFKLIFEFFTIYKPTFLELIFGTGPLNFNQLYVEANQQIFLSQHSLIVSVLLFFGIFGIITILFTIFQKIKFKDKTYINNIFNIFLIFNFLINDSINFISVYIIYMLFFNLLKNNILFKLNL